MKILKLILLSCLAFSMGPVLWAIPSGFNIQGRLTDANGVNKDGTFQIKFSVFAVAEGGASVWEKAMPAVMVKNGNFQVILQGEGNIGGQLEDAVKNLITAYVEIKVGTEPPLVPRQPLLRSPFGPPTVNLVGAVMFFAGAICPDGWLLANGATLTRTPPHENLFDHLGTAYDPAHVNVMLPNMLDGAFIRSPGGNAAAIGVKQADSVAYHTHADGYFYTYEANGVSKGSNGYHRGVASERQTPGMTPAGGVETRPLNYAMTPCVKY